MSDHNANKYKSIAIKFENESLMQSGGKLMSASLPWAWSRDCKMRSYAL